MTSAPAGCAKPAAWGILAAPVRDTMKRGAGQGGYRPPSIVMTYGMR
jgi:hypothetical protein